MIGAIQTAYYRIGTVNPVTGVNSYSDSVSFKCRYTKKSSFYQNERNEFIKSEYVLFTDKVDTINYQCQISFNNSDWKNIISIEELRHLIGNPVLLKVVI